MQISFRSFEVHACCYPTTVELSVLSGSAIVITNVETASMFLAKGWSTESVSRVVRTARTAQEKHEKERAEHACYSHIHDEVTVYDGFPATIQKLDEDENLPEGTTAQDDQGDETEQSLSETLHTRRQISKIRGNMGHPSNRTLVRVLRLGGAKRRFILAAARHRCGACEAQKTSSWSNRESLAHFLLCSTTLSDLTCSSYTHTKNTLCLP